MNSKDLRAALAALGLSQGALARLLGVTTRTVNFWAVEDRALPGPVAAYLQLLHSLPKTLQAKELARLNMENPPMYEGMYAFDYAAGHGTGTGVLVAVKGQVFGSDGDVQYDGFYGPSPDGDGMMNLHLRVTVPPGVPLVTGIPPLPTAYGFGLDLKVNPRGGTAGTVNTPTGPVDVVVRYLRSLPSELAA